MFSLPRLFKKNRNQKVLAILAFFLIAFFSLVFLLKKHPSTVLLTPGQNKFKLNFQLQKPDEPKLSNILSRLNLPPSIKQGIEFQLDSTSSAKLAYVSPLKSKLDIGDKSINFEGDLKRNLNGADFQFESIKLPDLTSLAILSQKPIQFLVDLSPSKEYKDWISKNVKSDSGVYLVVFGQSNDFAVAFKNSNFKVDQLKLIKDSNGEGAYKEKTIDKTSYGLFNLSDTGPVLAIVEKDTWNIIASSDNAAKQFSPKNNGGQVFPNIKKGSVVFALYFKNNGNNQDISKYIAKPDKLTKILDKVESFIFTLKRDSFSGSFSVK